MKKAIYRYFNGGFQTLDFHKLIGLSESNDEYVYTRKDGRQLFTGDVFCDEVEQDEGDVRIYQVLVWLPERFQYALLEYGEYIAHIDQGAKLDESENYQIFADDLEKLIYIGTIYDEKFKDLCSGPV